jgi:hypothetical protein
MPDSGGPPEDAPQSDEELPAPSEPDAGTENRPPVASSPDETSEERLARIQKNLAAGKYDSDEILDQAAAMMLRRILDERE